VSKFYFSFAQIPNQGVCGEPAVSSDIKRIVNGFNAVPNSYPWMVSLRILFTPTQVSSHFCGGTLIYENVILTAAHW
jgi:secreted trypsin-like serine protease